MRLDDGAVNAPLLLFFSFRPEVIQSDRLPLIRVAEDHKKSIGKRWGNSHAHDNTNLSALLYPLVL